MGWRDLKIKYLIMNYIKFILFQQEYKKEGAISHSFTFLSFRLWWKLTNFFKFSCYGRDLPTFSGSLLMVEIHQLFRIKIT